MPYISPAIAMTDKRKNINKNKQTKKKEKKRNKIARGATLAIAKTEGDNSSNESNKDVLTCTPAAAITLSKDNDRMLPQLQ